MMKFQMTLEAAIRAVKFTVVPFACWPLPTDANPSDIWRFNLWWWLVFVVLESSCVEIAWNVNIKQDNFNTTIIHVTELLAVISGSVKMVMCKVQASRLQGLLAELHIFLKRATKEEMETIQFYVDKCYVFHVIGYIFFVGGPIAYIAGPIILPQRLPVDRQYQCTAESFWLWLILYLYQCFILLHVGSMSIATYVYSILLWFVVARFKINCLEFQNATTSDDLRRSILNHQKLIEYADQVRQTTRPMALHVTSGTVVAVTIGSFMLSRVRLSLNVSEEKGVPSFDVVKYFMYSIGSALQFFTFAWPADNLMDMSMKIGDSAYSSGWVGKPDMFKDIITIMQKTQFPTKISYDGLLPAVSLSLFRAGMAATFSYQAMLRALAED